MNIDSTKVSGVVVLYKPDLMEVIKNVASYIDWLEMLFVWCNSPISDEQKMVFDRAFPGRLIRWEGNGSNMGMAYALNAAAKRSLDFGCRFLLTMDQDSFFYSDSFFHAFLRFQEMEAAIWAPFSYGALREEHISSDFDAIEASLVITSGCLIDLEKFRVSGGFDEDFFIDEVDHDYCLIVQSLGWSVFRIFPVTLGHSLGTCLNVGVLGLRREIIVHSGVRLYYITRNTLLLAKKHFLRFPLVVSKRIWYMMVEWGKVLFFSSIRATEFKYIRRGLVDFFYGNFGKGLEQ